jgi:hypothetical protein
LTGDNTDTNRCSIGIGRIAQRQGAFLAQHLVVKISTWSMVTRWGGTSGRNQFALSITDASSAAKRYVGMVECLLDTNLIEFGQNAWDCGEAMNELLNQKPEQLYRQASAVSEAR